jgi:glycosyltransferase involved in cell wall biosynthesis
VTRALWVTSEAPDFGLGGGNIRQAHLLAALGRAAETDLVLLGRLEDDRIGSLLARVIELPKVWVPGVPRQLTMRRLRDLWWALGARLPRELELTRRERRQLTPALGNAESYDLVCVEHHWLAPLLPAKHSNRWVLTFQSLLSTRLAHESAITEGRRQRWLVERDTDKARRMEAWAVRAYDLVVVPSPEDAAALGGRAVVVPNGVDVDAFVPSPLPAAPEIVMTGTFSYNPNVDGALWFCREVLPKIREVVPAAYVHLVGRAPLPEVEELVDGRTVRGTFDVPSVATHLDTARVAVVPIRIGSGTRLKALEAMAAQRPVVGTAIGLEGLGIESGRHALVANDADEMAAAVVELLTDDGRATALAEAGRLLVEERYRWDAIAERFLTAVLPTA